MNMIQEGYPMNAIMSSIHETVVTKASFSDVDKALICEKIAQVEECLIGGSSEFLQLCDLSAFIMRRCQKMQVHIDMMYAVSAH